MTFETRVDSSKKNLTHYVKTLSAVLNPEENGGESITLEVDYFKNEDGDVYTNIHIENTCYGTHSSKTSYYNLGLERLEAAFKHAQEVAFLLSKNINLEDI